MRSFKQLRWVVALGVFGVAGCGDFLEHGDGREHDPEPAVAPRDPSKLAELFVPPPCDAEDCVGPDDPPPEGLEPLSFTEAEYGINCYAGPCDYTMTMCDWTAHADAVVIAQTTSPAKRITFACGEPESEDTERFAASLNIISVIGGPELPRWLPVITAGFVWPRGEWEGLRLVGLRYLDGRWVLVQDVAVTTPEALEADGYPVNRCAHFELSTTVEGLRAQFEDTRAVFVERCAEHADHVRSDAELMPIYYGEGPRCGPTVLPRPGEGDVEEAGEEQEQAGSVLEGVEPGYHLPQLGGL